MAIFPTPNLSANADIDDDEIPVLAANTTSAAQQVLAGPQSTPPSPSNLVRGTSVSLAIDLDEHGAFKQNGKGPDPQPAYKPRREPLRRDSLNRREALLKGKEGSRRRRQWENGAYITRKLRWRWSAC